MAPTSQDSGFSEGSTPGPGERAFERPFSGPEASAGVVPGTERGPGPIRFWLNDAPVGARAAEGRLVLDWLRRRAGLRGTKEGCREGDCGACVVLVGELEGQGEAGAVRYRPVTSCLLPVGELHGKHLVTVEGLLVDGPSAGDARATPVQRAIVEAGASQCGFCTPGIVMSLTAMALESAADPGPAEPSADADDLTAGAGPVERALSGHLCRCTGYRSLRRAGEEIVERVSDALVERSKAGESTADPASDPLEVLVEQGWVPPYFLDMLPSLEAIPPSEEPRRPQVSEAGAVARSLDGVEGAPAVPVVLAGGTDLYVQRGDELPRGPVRVLAHRADLRGVEEAESGSEVRVGAMTTFEDLVESPVFRRHVPGIASYMRRIASWQVRHRATVGGNLVNASPIGDVTVLMLALGAEAVLEVPRAVVGTAERTFRRLPLEDFYRGYKNLDLRPGELLAEVCFPATIPAETGDRTDLDRGGTDRAGLDRVDFQKVSKRPCLDIASVNTAARLRVEGGRVVAARLAAGGVAPVPLFLRRASAALVGLARDDPGAAATLSRTLDIAQEEASPIGDVRGSVEYKRLLLRQLLLASLFELLPDDLARQAGVASLGGVRGPS